MIAVGVLRFPSALKGSQGVGGTCQSHTDSLTTNPKAVLMHTWVIPVCTAVKALSVCGVEVHAGTHLGNSESLPSVSFCSNMPQRGLMLFICPGVSDAE